MMATVGLWAIMTALATAGIGVPLLCALDRSRSRRR